MTANLAEAGAFVGLLSARGHPARLLRDASRTPEPMDVRLRRGAPLTGTLSQALTDGEIDALMAPWAPPVFRREGGDVRRVLPDYAERETDVIRAYPWVARSLCTALRTMPFPAGRARTPTEDLRRGPLAVRPDGDRAVLAVFADHLVEQGLTANRIE